MQHIVKNLYIYILQIVLEKCYLASYFSILFINIFIIDNWLLHQDLISKTKLFFFFQRNCGFELEEAESTKGCTEVKGHFRWRGRHGETISGLWNLLRVPRETMSGP